MNKKISLIAFASLLLLSIFTFAVPNTSSHPSPQPTKPTVYVLIWPEQFWIYNNPFNITIKQYKADLEEIEGFSVVLKYKHNPSENLPDTAEGIRELLQNASAEHELAGALLVGDVPYAMYKEDSYPYETFPTDFYYMDLDGNWTDSNSDGKLDTHTDGNGDKEPEIWVGRLYSSTLRELFYPDVSEEWHEYYAAKMICNYFVKIHSFRMGEITLPRQGIGYLDDDIATWESFKFPGKTFPYEWNVSLSMIYEDEVTMVTENATTTVEHYLSTLNDSSGYEWLLLGAHSSPIHHGFYDPNSTPPSSWSVHSSDIRDIDPKVFFYNLYACRCANYTRENYIGGAYIFGNPNLYPHTYSLLVVGSTKSGGMWNTTDFYEPITQGKCVGQAYKEWSEINGILEPPYQVTGSYGFTILGDPTLRSPRTYNQTHDVAVTDISAVDREYGFTNISGSWLGDWQYRQLHNISGSATNYPLFFNVYSGSGTSSGDKIYLGGNCTSFPQDINFTDSSNKPYYCWMEAYNSSWAGVWVNVTSVPTTDLFVYYGSYAQTSFANNVDKVMRVYHDFEDGMGGWWEENPNVEVSSNEAFEGTYSLRAYYSGNNVPEGIETSDSNLGDFILTAHIKDESTGDCHGCDLLFRYQDTDNHYGLQYRPDWDNKLAFFVNDNCDSTQIASVSITADGQWHKLTIALDTWDYEIYLDDELKMSGTIGPDERCFSSGYVGVQNWWNNPNAYYDVFYVADYDSGVSHGGWGPTQARPEPEGVLHKGWDVNVTVTVENQGIFVENISVTLYRDTTEIETQNVWLQPEDTNNLTFIWDTNTIGSNYGYYTIKAVATVSEDDDTSDNTKVLDEIIRVKIQGDVDSDGDVDTGDQRKLQSAMFSFPGNATWNVNADVDQDRNVDSGDMAKLINHMFEHE